MELWFSNEGQLITQVCCDVKAGNPSCPDVQIFSGYQMKNIRNRHARIISFKFCQCQHVFWMLVAAYTVFYQPTFTRDKPRELIATTADVCSESISWGWFLLRRTRALLGWIALKRMARRHQAQFSTRSKKINNTPCLQYSKISASPASNKKKAKSHLYENDWCS